jgi:small conductance mechanosensitive channel
MGWSLVPVAVVAAQGAESTAEDVLPQGLTAADWIVAGAVLVLGIVLGRIVRSIVARVVENSDSDRAAALFVGRFLGYLLVLAGFVYALSILEVRLAPVLGAIGIGGLAIAFAAQAILANVFAAVVLQTRRPFRRGDQIETNGYEGVVEEINFRTVVLRTYAGERVLVPCSEVLDNPITNYTANRHRRTTLMVGVSYDADLRDAQRLLVDATGGVDGVIAAPGPEAWVETFGESTVDFAVRFWHRPDIATMWRVRSEVAMAVKSALDEAGIEIPFPQRTLSFQPDAIDLHVAERADTHA